VQTRRNIFWILIAPVSVIGGLACYVVAVFIVFGFRFPAVANKLVVVWVMTLLGALAAVLTLYDWAHQNPHQGVQNPEPPQLDPAQLEVVRQASDYIIMRMRQAFKLQFEVFEKTPNFSLNAAVLCSEIDTVFLNFDLPDPERVTIQLSVENTRIDLSCRLFEISRSTISSDEFTSIAKAALSEFTDLPAGETSPTNFRLLAFGLRCIDRSLVARFETLLQKSFDGHISHLPAHNSKLADHPEFQLDESESIYLQIELQKRISQQALLARLQVLFPMMKELPQVPEYYYSAELETEYGIAAVGLMLRRF